MNNHKFKILTGGGIGDVLLKINRFPFQDYYDKYGCKVYITYIGDSEWHKNMRETLKRELFSKNPMFEYVDMEEYEKLEIDNVDNPSVAKNINSLNLDNRKMFKLHLSDEENKIFSNFDRNKINIGIQLHQHGFPFKKWDIENYKKLIDFILAMDERIIIHLIDGPDCVLPNNNIFLNKRVFSHIGCNISQSISIVSKMDGNIAVDSWTKYVSLMQKTYQLILISKFKGMEDDRLKNYYLKDLIHNEKVFFIGFNDNLDVLHESVSEISVGEVKEKAFHMIRKVIELKKVKYSKTSKIINLKSIDMINAGDRCCSVLDYFDFEDVETETICITTPKEYFSSISEDTKIIIGGGGCFCAEKLMNYLSKICPDKVITWSAGFNSLFSYEKVENINKYNPLEKHKFLSNFRMNGIRDNICGVKLVPCVSCMNSKFDIVKNSKHLTKEKFIVYSHFNHEQSGDTSRILDLGYPYLENNSSLEEIINHIMSGEVVITNSYHGAYWSSLLNKKAIIVPFSTRMLNFNLPNVIIENNIDKLSDENYLNNITSNLYNINNYLDECRNINIEYSKKVSYSLGIKINTKK